MKMDTIYDIIVVGAGPVGLYAAFAAAEMKFNTVLVDALPEVGGQLTAFYPQKFIFDVAGYPRVTAGALVNELRNQVRQHDVRIELNFKVIGMISEPTRIYQVSAEDGRQLSGRYILIAAGAGLITPRKLELAEADKYLGLGLEYVVRNVEEYRNRRALIVGGGDTALDWAIYFTAISKEVTLIHRSARFIGFEGSLHKLGQTSCRIFTNTVLTGIEGDGRLERVRIANSEEGWTKELETDRVLGCIGFTPKLGFLKECGLEIAEGSIGADSQMRTRLYNVYAVGDISNHPGRIKLISTGFGNVGTALNHISKLEKGRLRPS